MKIRFNEEWLNERVDEGANVFGPFKSNDEAIRWRDELAPFENSYHIAESERGNLYAVEVPRR